jgi:hypothetical protein
MALLYCVNERVVTWYDQDQGVPASEYGPDCIIIPWKNTRTLQKIGAAPKDGYDSRPYAAPVLQGEQLIDYAKFKHERLIRGGVTVEPNMLVLTTDAQSLVLLHSLYNHASSSKKASDKFDLVGADHKLHALDAKQVVAVFAAVNAFMARANTTLARIIDAINQGFVENVAMIDRPVLPLPPWPSSTIPI